MLEFSDVGGEEARALKCWGYYREEAKKDPPERVNKGWRVPAPYSSNP